MPTEYEDRTTPEGKTSSVHWVRFSFSAEAVVRFASNDGHVLLEITHPEYQHIAVLSEAARSELARDFIHPE